MLSFEQDVIVVDYILIQHQPRRNLGETAIYKWLGKGILAQIGIWVHEVLTAFMPKEALIGCVLEKNRPPV